MKNITILTIDVSFQGKQETFYPVVLQDGTTTALIDCGCIGSMDLIERSMEAQGILPQTLTHILITHHDHDHMGALFDFKQKYPGIKVVASRTEAPYISGKKKSPRLIQAEQLQERLPEEQKAFGEAFMKVLKSVKPVAVDIEVDPDDILDWCGSCRVIATPGHTPGHIALWVHQEDALIAGDAVTIENNKLVIANPQFTLDLETANQTMEKIRTMHIRTILCYHGGCYEKIDT